MSFKIQLEKFEGPLDLLLYFIRRDELDIYDIPISKITKEFVHTIEEWKKAFSEMHSGKIIKSILKPI